MIHFQSKTATNLYKPQPWERTEQAPGKSNYLEKGACTLAISADNSLSLSVSLFLSLSHAHIHVSCVMSQWSSHAPYMCCHNLALHNLCVWTCPICKYTCGSLAPRFSSFYTEKLTFSKYTSTYRNNTLYWHAKSQHSVKASTDLLLDSHIILMCLCRDVHGYSKTKQVLFLIQKIDIIKVHIYLQ